jgi:hypothetical protein
MYVGTLIKNEFDHFEEKCAKIIQIFLSKGSDPDLDPLQLFWIRPGAWCRVLFPTCARLTILTRQRRQGRGSASRFFVLPPIPRYSLRTSTHSHDYSTDQHIRISVAIVLRTRIGWGLKFLAGSGQLRIRNEFEIKLLWQKN